MRTLCSSGFLVCSVVILGALLGFHPRTADPIDCDIENIAFGGGERLVYKAYYNWGFLWIPAGEAVFNVVETRDHYEIFVSGSSYPSYDGFFRLRDKFYSKIDKYSLLPVVFERKVEEGDYRKYERIEFDQVHHKAVAWTGKTRSTAVPSTVSFDRCKHDILSLLYFMRNIDVQKFRKGDFIPTQIFFDKEIYDVKVRFEGKEAGKYIRDKGRFNTIKVVPDLIAGTVFNEGDKMQVWVTDDTNKIPLLVESPLKIGSLKAVIKSYSGLKRELTSKIH